MFKISHFIDDSPAKYVAAIGFFDGVHCGHRYLIRQVRDEAARAGLSSAVVTFEEHPRRTLSADYQPQLLNTNDEKLRLLRQSGLDACIMLHFTPEMAQLTAEAFMRDYLKTQFGVEVLVLGYDHHFGSDHLTFEGYEAAGRRVGIRVVKEEALKNADFIVSSSAIRRLLAAGDVAQAAEALGYRYELSGTVVEGRRVGRDLGFPTANLRPASPLKLIPCHGVYAAEAEVGGRTYGAMVNIGQRPTLDNGTDTTIEANLFDFIGDLYAKNLTLRFVARLRDEQRFPSLDALRSQLKQDEQAARRVLAETSTDNSNSL